MLNKNSEILVLIFVKETFRISYPTDTTTVSLSFAMCRQISSYESKECIENITDHSNKTTSKQTNKLPVSPMLPNTQPPPWKYMSPRLLFSETAVGS